MAAHGLRLQAPVSIRQANWQGKLVTLALLLVLLASAVAGVNSVLIGPDWAVMWTSILFGLLTGWLLALFKQPGLRAAWVSAGLALLYSLLFVGGLGKDLLAVLKPLAWLSLHILSIRSLPVTEWQLLSRQALAFAASTGVIASRIGGWVEALISESPVFDPAAATLVWSLLVWLIAAWAGWLVEARKNTLLAILPAMLLSAGALSYARQSSFVLYPMLGAALLLLAIVRQDWRGQSWDETGTAYPKRKGRQIGLAAALLTLGLVLLAAWLPNLSISRFTKWLATHNRPASQESGLAQSLGIISPATAPPDVFAPVRRPGLPRDLLIGSGPELSEKLVMSIEVSNLSSLPQASQQVPFYWRSFSYDLYTGHGWSTSDIDEQAYQANEPFQEQQEKNHWQMHQTIHLAAAEAGALYASGDPFEVDQPAVAARRSSGDLFGIQLAETSAYQVASLLPVATADELRRAGQSYPDWLRQRYLALPPALPARVKALAIELTASQPTPYDRAKAIESYLRTFPYTLDVSRPPLDRDLVDYFLNDLQQGYCDYYASAMVVLARASGIPARLAVGYASGTFNLNSRRFVVTQADAHSWAEIYFPGSGWVPFEPTAARPSFERSLQSAASPETQNHIPPAAPFAQPQPTGRLPGFWPVAVGGIVLAMVLAAAWSALDAIRLRRLAEPAAIAEIYRRLQGHGRRLAVTAAAGATPYEFVASFKERLQEIASKANKSQWGQQLSAEIDALVGRIVNGSYRASSFAARPDSGLYSLWRGLHRRLLLFELQSRVESVGRRVFMIGTTEAESGQDGIERRDGS